jgi:cobalt-zinc-cadmium efflux system protein
MTGGHHNDHSHRACQGHGGHTHGDHGQIANFGRAFAIGIGLNAAFVLIEAGYGFVANSTALLADAGHNLSDVLGLLVAWIAAVLSRRPPTPIESLTVIVVAATGIIINGITAWLFASGRNTNLNIRGAYLHMMADAAVSFGVVLAATAIMATGWLWLDPAMSLVIVAVIVAGTWSLLRESTAMTLAAVPSGIDPAAVRAFLTGHSGVASIHDLHIWAMSTTETALTAHLVMPAGNPGDAFLIETCHELQHRFGIGHATLQIETSIDVECALAPDHVV